MKVEARNLDSAFDWCADVESILKRVGSVTIQRRLGSGKLPIESRLRKLRQVFLVSEFLLVGEWEASSPDWDDCLGGAARTGSNPVSAWPTEEVDPGCRGRWHRSEQCSAVVLEAICRQPRLGPGNAIVEALGVYVPDLAEFVNSQSGRRRPNSIADELTKPRGSDQIALEGPAVFICPEAIIVATFGLVADLRSGEPHPESRFNMTELFLRMTLLHELGHHLLPVVTGDNPHWLGPDGVVLSEALANHFCRALLEDVEAHSDPSLHLWQFLKAWHLQPPMYLAYAVPSVLQALDGSWDGDAWWKNMVRSRFGAIDQLPPGADQLPLATASVSSVVLSPKMARALQGLCNALQVKPPGNRGATGMVLPMEEYELCRG